MSTTEPLDVITITEQITSDQQSTGADVLVKVERTGLAARHAAALLRARAALVRAGVAEEAISTHNVSQGFIGAWMVLLGAVLAGGILFLGAGRPPALATAGGTLALAIGLYLLGAARLLGASTFTLKVRCPDAAAVGRVLDVTAASGGLDLEQILWRYDVAPQDRSALVEECIRRAGERAARVARGLGVRILGVHAYGEVHEDPQGPQPEVPLYVAAASKARRSEVSFSGPPRHGPMAASERARVTISVQYRIGGYEPR